MNPSNVISLSNIELTRFLFAIILLLFSSHLFGYIFQKINMPRVIGEIFGGLLLGPSFLGFFAPEVYSWIFNSFPAEGKLLSGFYWLGLVLLMFISGFELQNSFKKDDKKIILALLFGGTILPFLAGFLIPNFYDVSFLYGKVNNPLAFNIILGIAIAITSIPVISKIFIDLNIINTRFAKIVLAIATIEDILLYAALAIATGIISTKNFSQSTIGTTIAFSFLFLAVGLIILPKILNYLHDLKINYLKKSSTSGYILLLCFSLAAIANILNVNIIFGALIAGVALRIDKNSQFEKVKTSIKEFSLAFFIPIYFAIVGIKLDLIHHFNILFFIGFLLFAVFFKLLGIIISARLLNKDWLSSLNIGIAMNARGGPGIVLATIAFDIGIINEDFFSSLVMLAIITSLVAGYWFRFILNNKLELLKD